MKSNHKSSKTVRRKGFGRSIRVRHARKRRYGGEVNDERRTDRIKPRRSGRRKRNLSPKEK